MRSRPRLLALATLVTTGCLAAGAAVAAPAVAAPAVQRVYGDDRVRTAIAASQSYPAGSAEAVVLTRSDDFADSLAAGPLASDRGGPLLLTPRASLPAAVADEIRRVLAPGGTVYLLGGTSALSADVEAALTGAGLTTRRVQGRDRYATAVAVAELLPAGRNVALVTGLKFPDGLAAGALMGVQDGATADTVGVVLLTAGTSMPAVTRDYVLQRGFADTGYVMAVGGDAVRASQDLGVPQEALLQVAGANRYDTAARVANQFLSNGYFFTDAGTAVGVATGEDWPDALAGSALMGYAAGPLLLTRRTSLPTETTDALRALARDAAGIGGVTTALVFGGPGAVSLDQDAAISSALG